MNSFKRITGLVLALLLVIGMVPVGAFADTVTYTSIDARVYNAVIGGSVSNAEPNIQFATDEMSALHKPDTTVNVDSAWYHIVDSLDTVAENDKAKYSLYTYGAYQAYARPVAQSETFAQDNQYLYVGTLTPTNGVFADDCLIGPLGGLHVDITPAKSIVYLNVTPTESTTIDWIDFTCTNEGNITITNVNSDLVYLYKVSNGSEIVDSMYGAPVGKYVLSNAECRQLAGKIDITNNPVITLYAVPAMEWADGRTSKVVAYGTYTIPMADPYIEVDTLTFGDYISVTEIGTTTGGQYHWNTAQATFEGWFTDKEGTTPAVVEADAYAIFTLRSYGLFAPNIKAEDFTLKCGNERYQGAYLFPQTESNTYKIAFMVPSNRISFTLEVVGEGGSMTFVQNPNESTISMRPLESGKYAAKDIVIAVEPGYFLKSLTVNGKEWDDIRNPLQSGMMVIPNDETFYASIASFEPTEDTVIRIEVAPADRVTIDYGEYKPTYTGRYADETKWHSNGQYWVTENGQTELCYKYAITDYDGTMVLKGLNTKSDGSGTSVPMTSTHFYWESTDEYKNGMRDEITLYVIMECKAHTEYGADDSAWEYRDAKDASCTEEGHAAHRYCPNCKQYQIKKSDGTYVASTLSEITIEKLPHKHTIYSNTSNTHHTVKCENCTDSHTEEHKLVNGVCVCGYFTYLKGDVNQDGSVTDADAVHLLYYTIFPEDYPINQPADFNGDGSVTDADAVHLLYYTIFPEDYPLL